MFKTIQVIIQRYSKNMKHSLELEHNMNKKHASKFNKNIPEFQQSEYKSTLNCKIKTLRKD